MPALPTWPAAASARGRDALDGPCLPATVLGVFRHALHLHTLDPRTGEPGAVLPVVTPQGLRLPTALVATPPVATMGWGVQPGDQAVVGDGAVRLPGVELRVVRTWRPGRVATASDTLLSPATLAGAVGTLDLPWREPARHLVAAMRRGQPAHAPAAALVGRGAGLTPSADDMLCGVLLALRLHGPASARLVPALWSAIEPVLPATTSLSAALLAEAAQGYAVPAVLRLASVLAAGASGEAAAHELSEAVAAVLAVGHSSGADLLSGMLGTFDVLSGTLTPAAAGGAR